MPNLTLFDLSEQYKADLAGLTELDLPEQVVKDTVEGLSGALEVKAQNVLAFAANLEAEAEAVAQRVKALQARQKALQARAGWLQNYVLYAMQNAGIHEIRCADFVAKPRQNPERVVIDNEAGLPAKCWRIIPEQREPDKQAIKDALKAGDSEVSQAAHLERGWRLDVR